MGRPKKPEVVPEPELTKPENVEIPVTPEEEQSIPAPVVEVMDEVKFIPERIGEGGAAEARKMPSIIAGVCENCGSGEYDSKSSPQRQVADWTVHPETQLGRCKHYNGVKIRCTYCPLNTNWSDVVRHRRFNIWEYPVGSKRLILLCDDMNCVSKHLSRVQSK